ncbi:MAG: LysM peptidoglycan-binding domain-containing protein [Verrucomicrobiota bacterium]
MKMLTDKLIQRAAIGALALLTPISLTQCVSTGGTGGGVVSANDLATPSHGLSREDYPFDEHGNYREDWAEFPGGGGSSSRSSSRSSGRSSGSSSRSSGSSSSSSSGSTTTSTYKPPSSSSKLSTSGRTHTVTSGDTLWGISRKYGVSVTTIKAKNGLTSDLIRPGQKLKL